MSLLLSYLYLFTHKYWIESKWIDSSGSIGTNRSAELLWIANNGASLNQQPDLQLMRTFFGDIRNFVYMCVCCCCAFGALNSLPASPQLALMKSKLASKSDGHEFNKYDGGDQMSVIPIERWMKAFSMRMNICGTCAFIYRWLMN